MTRKIVIGAILACLMGVGAWAAINEAVGRPAPGVAEIHGGKDGSGNVQIIGIGVTGAAAPANGTLVGGTGFNGVLTAPRYCDKTANITTLGTTATVQQIAAVASQNIYICGIILNASTATAGTTLVMVEGTGSNCATGASTVGALFAATPTAAPTAPNLVLALGQAARATNTAGDALCFQQGQTANSTALSGTILYTQN
jgi:hypothetical protein